MVLGDVDRLPQFLFKGPHHPRIGGHTPLERDGGLNFLSLRQIVQIITDKRLAQPGDDILSAQPFCNGSCPTRRTRQRPAMRTGKRGQRLRPIRCDPHTRGLPVQKRAGPRGTDGIHGEIMDDAVSHQYDL